MLVGNMIASWEDIHLPSMTCTSAPGPQEWQTESNFSQSEKVPTCQWYKVPDKDFFENKEKSGIKSVPKLNTYHLLFHKIPLHE